MMLYIDIIHGMQTTSTKVLVKFSRDEGTCLNVNDVISVETANDP